MQSVDWGSPDALAAALAARPGGRVCLAAGAGERAMDALALGAGRVTACVASPAERAMLDLRARALECLPPDQVWALLGAGRHPGPAAVVELLSLRMSPESGRFWRRNAYVLTNLFRHGRAGWLMWLFDAALGACGVPAVAPWPDVRWRVNALLYFAFMACPVSPALGLGAGHGRALARADSGWYEYAMARAEAALGAPGHAPQVDVLRCGAYDVANAPPHLRPGAAADVVARLPRLGALDAPLERALGREVGAYDVVALWGLAEASTSAALAARVERALAPGGVAIVASVLEEPSALLARFTLAGLDVARPCACRPGVFASHWLVSRG